MDIEGLKKLLDLMEERGVGEIEVRSWFQTVRINRAGAAYAPGVAVPAAAYAGPAPTPATGKAETAGKEAAAEEKLVVVKSPMVGTFYRSPGPDADPFVTEGTAVKKGQVLCIIEAMKIMNEIECEHAGTVVKIHVENAAPVEFGQPLFSLRPA